jgi:hypothetical protein
MFERIAMALIPSKRQWRAWDLPSKMTFIGAFISIFSLIISFTSLVFQPTSSTDIESKIKELDNIKVALTSLSTYVGNQQKALKDIADKKGYIRVSQICKSSVSA